VRTRLAASRAAAGLTQKEMAWAIGIPIAIYVRLERGKHPNPRLGWLVNAAEVLSCGLEEVLDDEMLTWYSYDRPERPPNEWHSRPEVHARSERWRQESEKD
jgi:DNA-binding XRE family transcriptional regulator